MHLVMVMVVVVVVAVAVAVAVAAAMIAAVAVVIILAAVDQIPLLVTNFAALRHHHEYDHAAHHKFNAAIVNVSTSNPKP